MQARRASLSSYPPACRQDRVEKAGPLGRCGADCVNPDLEELEGCLADLCAPMMAQPAGGRAGGGAGSSSSVDLDPFLLYLYGVVLLDK